MKKLIDYINKIVPLNHDEEEIILSKLRKRRYLKNQYVVQQGDICMYLSFVISGCMKTFYVDNDGNEHIIMFSIENWWAGDITSFVKEIPADFNVQCLENCEVIQFSSLDLNYLYDTVPKFERMFRIILENAYAASQKRIIESYSMTAKDRYLKFRDQYPSIGQRVPQYMIASYLGITKEFLSKIRNQIIHEN